jgi:hypothetical protein
MVVAEDLVQVFLVRLGPVTGKGSAGPLEKFHHVARYQPAFACPQLLEIFLQRAPTPTAAELLPANFRKTVEIFAKIKTGHRNLDSLL